MPHTMNHHMNLRYEALRHTMIQPIGSTVESHLVKIPHLYYTQFCVIIQNKKLCLKCHSIRNDFEKCFEGGPAKTEKYLKNCANKAVWFLEIIRNLFELFKL